MSKSIKKTLFFLIYLSAISALGLSGRSYAASFAYVSNSYDNTVSVVGLSDNTVTTSINVGSWPYGVAVSPAGDYVYVTNGGDDTVSVIRTFDNIVTASVSVGKSPGGIAVNSDGTYVYVTNNDDDSVSVIQTSTNTVISTIEVGLWPEGLAVSPEGEYVYVVNTGDDSLSVIQTYDHTVVETIQVGQWPYGVAVSPAGNHVYVSNTGDNTVSVIRTIDSTVLSTVKVGRRPIGLDLTPDGEYLYVAASTDNALSVIRTSDNTVIATTIVDEWPWGVTVTPSGEYVYVSNIADDTVSVIRTADNIVTDTIPVGADPYSLGEFIAEVPDNINWLDTVVGGERVGILGKTNVISVESIESVDPYTIADEANKPRNLPLGLIGFNLKVDSPGDIAEVTIYFPNPAGENTSWHKYDPINGWQDYSVYSRFSADRRSVTLELKDGGHGDADGTENGIIVDPGGLGSTTSSVSGGGGGGGGCFIATAAYGSQVERHVAKHDALRTGVRWSLLPLIGPGWLTLQPGPMVTFALTFFLLTIMSAGCVILFKRIYCR